MKRLIGITLTLCLACTAFPAFAEPEIVVPKAYTQTGTLPVYRATARDFGETIQPELFNQSGVASRDAYTVVFADEAVLDWAPEALFYEEYEGTYNGNYWNPELAADMLPLPTLGHAAADLAGHVYSKWPDGGNGWEGIALTKTELSGITLDAAKTQVEALLAALHVDGYTCYWSLDMDTERIQSMGERMNEIVEEYQWNAPILDYSKVSPENEGFFLHYQNGIETDGDIFSVYAYVTGGGIVSLRLRDAYIRGEIYETPASLIGPETVLEKLPAAVAESRFPSTVVSVSAVRLTYAPMRASNKADGMVLSPVWRVIYQDIEGAAQGYLCWAEFDAVDGKLLNAIFK